MLIIGSIYRLSISINSSPVIVSFSSRKPASSSILARFDFIISLALLNADSIISRTSESISDAVSGEHASVVSPPRYALFTVSSAIIPYLSLMPYRDTIALAIRVACSMSFEAPVVSTSNITFSAALPPVNVAILFSSSCYDKRYCS